MMMLQPMWVTIMVQMLTLIVAGGISYGMTRAKLSSNEKEIVKLQAKMAEIEKDFAIWQRQRLTSVVTSADCDKSQLGCRDALCKKIDELGTKFDTYTKASNATSQSLALVIGAMCQKLNIPLPELR